MSVMKTSLTIFPCVLGSAFLYIRVCPGLSFATKRIGPPSCTLFTLLLVTRYKLSYHKTICYHLFQYLQRIPCWKPLIISFCSSLGLTLLLIKRTAVDPLYLWVIKDLYRSNCITTYVIPFVIGMLLARDSIVGIIIPSSISLPASLFTRSVMHHPVTNSLVTLLARLIVMCITERA